MKGFKFHHNLIYISVIMYAFDNHKWIYVFTFGMILGILLTIGELVEQWEKKQMLDIKGGINETLKDIEEFKKDLESKNETPNE